MAKARAQVGHRRPVPRTMARMRTVRLLVVALVVLCLSSAPLRADDGTPPGAPPADGGAAPGADPEVPPDETPAQREKRLRLELDDRRTKLPASALSAMEILDTFRDRELRVWNTSREEIVELGADALPALEIALDELDWETRAFAASCIGALGDPSLAAHLADAYPKEEFVEARRQYVLAMGVLGAASSKETLLAAAEDDDTGIRLAACRALGRIGGEDVVQVLRRHITADDLDLRFEVLGGLAAAGDDAARESLLQQARNLVDDRKLRSTDSLVTEDNDDRYKHYLLALALARAADPEGDKMLFDAVLLEKPWDKKRFFRMGAAEGLGRRGAADPESMKKVAQGISHKKNEARVACSYAAGFMGHEDLVPRLERALGDSQLDVRANAVLALGRIPTAASADALRKALSDKDADVRLAAVRALKDNRTPVATDALVRAVKDDKFVLRVTACRALARRTAEPDVVETLTRAAKDPDYGVRAQAVASLAYHSDGAAVLDPVVAALDDVDHGVQANACLGLAKLRRVADVASRQDAARRGVDLHVNAVERKLLRASEEYIDAVRPPAAVPALILALDSKNDEVRRRANVLLMRIAETSMDFDPSSSGDDRRKAIKRWEDWWAAQDGKLRLRDARIRIAITGELTLAARDLKWKGLDIALLFDSTYSMAGLIRAAKSRVDEIIEELGSLIPSLRVSVYTYRDYGDDFVYWGTPLTYDTVKLKGFLQNAVHGQGGDIPEAVFETVTNVMENLQWREGAHKVIVYAGDAPHHKESEGAFLDAIKRFCTPENNGVLHAVFTDTNRRSLDIAKRKKREEEGEFFHPYFELYKKTAEAGRGQAILLNDESALIQELLILTFGEAWRPDIENLLEFER